MLTVQPGNIAFLVYVLRMPGIPVFTALLRADQVTTIVNFIPKNRPVVLRVPSTTRTVSDWSSAALDVLKGLLECTGEPVWPSGKAVGW